MNRSILTIGMIFLFVVSAVSPIVFGYNYKVFDKKETVERYTFGRHLYPEFYDFNNDDEISDYIEQHDDISIDYENSKSVVSISEEPVQPLDGPMDSAWPMHGQNVRHTGRSPNNTEINPGWEKWRFQTDTWVLNSLSIDNNGVIYISSHDLFAFYPNGTLKWKYNTGSTEFSCPAIDENGVIYIGDFRFGNYFYAINSNGTLKWKYKIGGMLTSPVIADDGTIIFGDTNNWNIIALYPNGTLKWKYKTNHVIYSSPAIGLDGTIYCGSHDDYVYALYPNNGTIRWKYKTGAWVHGFPTIADDGTVYIGSDDNYLYALYPNNGTLKWKVGIGATFGSVALDKDGTIYAGVWQNKLHAINPNGTIKWSFNTGGSHKVWGSSPALSDDGIIYFGTCDLEYEGGLHFVALNNNGTLNWRKHTGTLWSSPAIDKDGTVYVGASGVDKGWLISFGVANFTADADGPYYGIINQPVKFEGIAYKGVKPYEWLWDFGDNNTSEEQNPIHNYTDVGNYIVILTVTDSEGNITDDTTLTKVQATNDPPEKPIINGRTKGEPHQHYPYSFISTDPEENPIWYYIDWGDDSNTGWLGPYDSGHQLTLKHTWHEPKIFIIKAKAKDVFAAESDWAILELNLPRNKATTSLLLLWFLERYPLMNRLFQRLGL